MITHWFSWSQCVSYKFRNYCLIIIDAYLSRIHNNTHTHTHQRNINAHVSDMATCETRIGCFRFKETQEEACVHIPFLMYVTFTWNMLHLCPQENFECHQIFQVHVFRSDENKEGGEKKGCNLEDWWSRSLSLCLYSADTMDHAIGKQDINILWVFYLRRVILLWAKTE